LEVFGQPGLHKWIDVRRILCKVSKSLGKCHRIEWHTLSSDYEKYIESRYGKKGFIEWLVHVALDNSAGSYGLETASKIAGRIYKKPYPQDPMDRKLEIVFDKTGIRNCSFK